MIPRRLALVTGVLLSAGLVGAQDGTSPPEEIPEFAVGTELVRIDVVVTDGDERPISSLTRDDFAVFEDEEPQEIVHFEVYSRRQQVFTDDEPAELEEPEPVATASGEEIEGYRRRHIVFAVDDLHIDSGNLSLAKQAMLRFVEDEIGPEDRVAIVATSGAHGMYQEFTNDRWALGLAVARVTPQLVRSDWTGPPRITAYQAELIERGDPFALELAVQEILQEEPPGSMRAPAESRARVRARAVRHETTQYVRNTLATLENVMRGLAELPGRKVIVLVSDGFLIGLGTGNDQAYDLRRITDAGTRAGVVLYSLDARGLIASPAGGSAEQRVGPLARAPGTRERMALQSEEALRDGMSALAKDTGGFLVYNTNDHWAGLDRILKDTETYYLLAYQPTNTKRDGRFRRIDVRLAGRRDLEVRTRRGYYAPDDREDRKPPPAPDPGQNADARTANDLSTALASLYPRSGIPLRLSAGFVSLGADGPRLVVNGNVDLSTVQFQRNGDRHVAAVVLAGVVYDAAGSPAANLEPQRIDLRLEAADYQRARKVGLSYKRILSLTPGAYEVRLAVRDDGVGTLGSASKWIEIPDVNGGTLALSDVFLLRGVAANPPGETGDPESAAAVRDVQAFPRFEPTDSLVYQVQILNPSTNAWGETDLTIQAHVLVDGQLLASTAVTPVARAQTGEVPQAYTGSISLEPFGPGEYDLQVAVTDHLVRSTLVKRIGFTVQ